RRAAVDPRDVHLERRERLPELVVDLARDPRAFFLERRLDVRGQIAELLLELTAVDRDAGQAGGPGGDLEIARIGTAGRAVVEPEGPEHAPVGRQDRNRPARAEAVREREVAEAFPDWVRRDVGHDDGALVKSRHSTGADLGAD